MSMMQRMIVSNLSRRPMRSLVSVVAVAIEVVLIMMVVGLVSGIINDHRDRISGIGADIVVQASGASVISEINGNTMPVAIAGKLDQVPGVLAAAPVAYKSISTGAEAVGGIDLAAFDRVSGGFHWVHGGMFVPGTHQVIIDDLEADAKHERVGERINLLGTTFTISGVFEHGMASRIMTDITTLDDLAGSPGKAAVFYVRQQPGTNTDDLVARLQQLLPNETVHSLADYLSLITAAGISTAVPVFQDVMIGIAVTIGFLVIFLSLYTIVLERTREIGILKSLGASRGYIVQAILRESELLAAVGVLLGGVSAFVLWKILTHAFPTLSLELTWKWLWISAAIAMASSVAGALYPAMKAAAEDPIAALAYE